MSSVKERMAAFQSGNSSQPPSSSSTAPSKSSSSSSSTGAKKKPGKLKSPYSESVPKSGNGGTTKPSSYVSPKKKKQDGSASSSGASGTPTSSRSLGNPPSTASPGKKGASGVGGIQKPSNAGFKKFGPPPSPKKQTSANATTGTSSPNRGSKGTTYGSGKPPSSPRSGKGKTSTSSGGVIKSPPWKKFEKKPGKPPLTDGGGGSNSINNSTSSINKNKSNNNNTTTTSSSASSSTPTNLNGKSSPGWNKFGGGSSSSSSPAASSKPSSSIDSSSSGNNKGTKYQPYQSKKQQESKEKPLTSTSTPTPTPSKPAKVGGTTSASSSSSPGWKKFGGGNNNNSNDGSAGGRGGGGRGRGGGKGRGAGGDSLSASDRSSSPSKSHGGSSHKRPSIKKKYPPQSNINNDDDGDDDKIVTPSKMKQRGSFKKPGGGGGGNYNKTKKAVHGGSDDDDDDNNAIVTPSKMKQRGSFKKAGGGGNYNKAKNVDDDGDGNDDAIVTPSKMKQRGSFKKAGGSGGGSGTYKNKSKVDSDDNDDDAIVTPSKMKQKQQQQQRGSFKKVGGNDNKVRNNADDNDDDAIVTPSKMKQRGSFKRNSSSSENKNSNNNDDNNRRSSYKKPSSYNKQKVDETTATTATKNNNTEKFGSAYPKPSSMKSSSTPFKKKKTFPPQDAAAAADPIVDKENDDDDANDANDRSLDEIIEVSKTTETTIEKEKNNDDEDDHDDDGTQQQPEEDKVGPIPKGSLRKNTTPAMKKQVSFRNNNIVNNDDDNDDDDDDEDGTNESDNNNRGLVKTNPFKNQQQGAFKKKTPAAAPSSVKPKQGTTEPPKKLSGVEKDAAAAIAALDGLLNDDDDDAAAGGSSSNNDDDDNEGGDRLVKLRKTPTKNTFSNKMNNNNGASSNQHPDKRASVNTLKGRFGDAKNETDFEKNKNRFGTPTGKKKNDSGTPTNKTKNFTPVKNVSSDESKARNLSPIRLTPKTSTTKAPPPPKAKNLLDKQNLEAPTSSSMLELRIKACQELLQDRTKPKEDKIEELVRKIDGYDGYPQPRRMSVRDNDIVQMIHKVIANDPTMAVGKEESTIDIDSDVRFEHLSKSLVVRFGDAFRTNFYVTSLKIRGVELGNDFLSALATSIMGSNFVLSEIDLSRNHFTNDGLVEFCQALQFNDTITKVNLMTQHSPIFETGYELVFHALEFNTTVTAFKVEFRTKEGTDKLTELLDRNRTTKAPRRNKDQKLIKFLEEEAEYAKDLWEHKQAEIDMSQVKDDDWDYLYELSVLFDQFKLQEDKAAKAMAMGGGGVGSNNANTSSSPSKLVRGTSGTPSNVASPSEVDKGKPHFLDAVVVGYTGDGAFLTNEFIDQYLKEDEESNSLIFDFCNQFKMFKRFPSLDPDREFIVNKFVDTLLNHPRSGDITGMNLANCCCGSDLFEVLADRCMADPSKLENLHLLNAETNYITESGVIALSKCIANSEALKYLQVVKLENQKALLTSRAEFNLAKALCVNRSVVRFNLRVRNLLEKEQINKYMVRNIDFLRQARRQHKIRTGTLEERKRNEMEQMFDKIAANDSSITEVNIVGNQKYLGLSQAEKVKSAAAFAKNTHVTTVMMSTLQLDDKFAVALGKALETNDTIEKLLLDSNAIAGDGLKAIFAGLGKNTSIIELQVRHQSKKCGSSDEEALPDLLEPNTTIIKLGIDLRSSLAKMKVDRKVTQNRELQRKQRAQKK